MVSSRKLKEPADCIRIGSVRTFLEKLEKIHRKESEVIYFRGHSDFQFQNLPSIYRNPGWIKNEDKLFKELILRCPQDFPEQASTFQTLVKMQHYSLPTRLLDLTSNPLVALFFACGSPLSATGEVVVFRVPKKEIKYFDSDAVSVISNISRRPRFIIPQAKAKRAFNKNQEIMYLLHEIKKEKPYFEPLIIRSDLESVVCVKPKLDNARIIRQSGTFFLFGVRGTKQKPAQIPSRYAQRSARLLVKQDFKHKILEQLEALGITQSEIFPEIESVANHIKERFFNA